MNRAIQFCLLVALVPLSTLTYAADLLATLAERSHQIQQLDGRFEQYKSIAVLPVPLHSTGRFNYSAGKTIVWETLDPIQQIIQISPEGIRFDGATKPTPQAAVETITHIFMGVVSGQFSNLENYFTIEPQGDSSHWVLILKPNSANLAAYIQGIEIRGGEYTEQLEIIEANGDKTKVRFTIDHVTRDTP